MKFRFPFMGSVPAPITGGEIVTKQVSSETLGTLKLGDLAISKVKKHLPHGAGNIEHDLLMSGCRSYETMKYARSCALQEPSPDSFERSASVDFDWVRRHAAIARAGKGGNCGEYAYDTAATLNKLVPAGTVINVCEVPYVDHAFVVLGKVQFNSAENKKLVVVDAWPPQAQAVLGDDYAFGPAADFRPSVTFIAEGPCAAGKKRITGLLSKVVNAGGKPALTNPAPAMPAGTEITENVWTTTHATRENAVITYVAADAPRGGGFGADEPR